MDRGGNERVKLTGAMLHLHGVAEKRRKTRTGLEQTMVSNKKAGQK